MRKPSEASKKRILTAPIQEIEDHGIAGFSIRRVAERCGVSCAAPYKHFKNKQVLILEVLRYVNREWYEISQRIIDEHPGDYRTALIEISVAYIHFLCDNPGFYSILLLNDRSLNEEQIVEKGKISSLTYDMIRKYCDSVQMSHADAVRKTYIVRSLIYGAAIQLISGSLEREENSYAVIRSCIEREFDLA